MNMHAKKHIAAVAAGAVIIAAGAFFAGDSYAKSGTLARSQFGNGQFAGRAGGMTGMRGTGSFTAGEVLSSQDGVLTLKMADGSTKLVLVGTSTQIMKSSPGTAADLSAGTTVLVTGSPNSDGSVTAQSVQIHPTGSPMPGRTGNN